MNKEEILKKVKELISDYQTAETSAIWEYSGEIEKDTKELEIKIAELNEYFERALGGAK